ncbi:MAG: Uma2 family endonuclease [Methylococcaceae bacterium]|nr:MAG: Uma2 family endonuclease [Methylococcaceae bacterium]
MSTAEKLKQKYTYGDYSRWPEDERWELIEGIPHAMTAPLRIHQEIVLKVGVQIERYLQGWPCKVYLAPFDVRLPRRHEADEEVETVVEPDIVVVCDKSKLDKKGCRGAPDWVIEVLSPATTFRDMNVKRGLYEAHGVREYWIVHPEDRWAMVYTPNKEGRYDQPAIFNMDEPSPVAIFPDLAIDWSFMSDV